MSDKVETAAEIAERLVPCDIFCAPKRHDKHCRAYLRPGVAAAIEAAAAAAIEVHIGESAPRVAQLLADVVSVATQEGRVAEREAIALEIGGEPDIASDIQVAMLLEWKVRRQAVAAAIRARGKK